MCVVAQKLTTVAAIVLTVPSASIEAPGRRDAIPSASSSPTLGPGGIAGVTVGAAAAVLGGVVALVWVRRRRTTAAAAASTTIFIDEPVLLPTETEAEEDNLVQVVAAAGSRVTDVV